MMRNLRLAAHTGRLSVAGVVSVYRGDLYELDVRVTLSSWRKVSVTLWH